MWIGMPGDQIIFLGNGVQPVNCICREFKKLSSAIVDDLQAARVQHVVCQASLAQASAYICKRAPLLLQVRRKIWVQMYNCFFIFQIRMFAGLCQDEISVPKIKQTD